MVPAIDGGFNASLLLSPYRSGPGQLTPVQQASEPQSRAQQAELAASQTPSASNPQLTNPRIVLPLNTVQDPRNDRAVRPETPDEEPRRRSRVGLDNPFRSRPFSTGFVAQLIGQETGTPTSRSLAQASSSYQATRQSVDRDQFQGPVRGLPNVPGILRGRPDLQGLASN